MYGYLCFKKQGSPSIYKRTQAGYCLYHLASFPRNFPFPRETFLSFPFPREQTVPALEKAEGLQFTSWFKHMGDSEQVIKLLKISFPIYKADNICLQDCSHN